MQYDTSTYLPASTFRQRKTGKLAFKQRYQYDITQSSIATGRERGENIDRNERYYTLCNRNEISDISSIVSMRHFKRPKKKIRYFINHPNYFKFSVLFNIHCLNKLIRICKFN